MRKYIIYYLDELEMEKNISANTRQSYERDLNRLITYLIESDVGDLAEIQYTHLNDYMMHLRHEGKANSTLSRHLAAFRGFFRYLEQERVLEYNPCKRITTPKKQMQLPSVMTLEEVELFLNQPDDSPKGLRDKAMLEVLYATGIRVSELINLTMSDINIPLGYIRCQTQKKARIIPIGKTCSHSIKKYLKDSRHQFLRQEEQVNEVFLNYQGKKLTRQGFWKIVKAYARRANIEKTITPHMLRHSFASHMVQNGADLNAVKEMMGHSDIASTQLYLNQKNHKIKEEYLKAHPRA